jgi:hypothetical protein
MVSVDSACAYGGATQKLLCKLGLLCSSSPVRTRRDHVTIKCCTWRGETCFRHFSIASIATCLSHALKRALRAVSYNDKLFFAFLFFRVRHTPCVRHTSHTARATRTKRSSRYRTRTRRPPSTLRGTRAAPRSGAQGAASTRASCRRWRRCRSSSGPRPPRPAGELLEML